jgi:hypothetical protein
MESVATPEAWQFNASQPLKGLALDNSFSDWPGTAEITWPNRRLWVRATNCGHLHIYTPIGRDFFCIEPQTAPAGALNHSEDSAFSNMATAWESVSTSSSENKLRNRRREFVAPDRAALLLGRAARCAPVCYRPSPSESPGIARSTESRTRSNASRVACLASSHSRLELPWLESVPSELRFRCNRSTQCKVGRVRHPNLKCPSCWVDFVVTVSQPVERWYRLSDIAPRSCQAGDRFRLI